MYLQHFGLREFPFSTGPDPRYYFPTARHKEGLACLLYAVQQRKGFALVTGEIGTGKTMLCRAALERFGRDVEAASLVHSSLSPVEFLQAVCAEFDVPWQGTSKVELLQGLRSHLLKRRQKRRTVVLILDEAQGLGPEVLEEVRLLGNLETSTEKLIQILLVGQPELRQIIGMPRLRALDQRIPVKFHLGPLAEDEVGDYIEHRLRVAGGSGLFAPDAAQEVSAASGGVPRIVNIICDQALLSAYAQDERVVTAETVRRVVEEMKGFYLSPASDLQAVQRLAHPVWASSGASEKAEGPPPSRADLGAQTQEAPAGEAVPHFPNVEEACEAIRSGLLVAGPSSPRGAGLVSYALDGAEVKVRLLEGISRDYVALVLGEGHGRKGWLERALSREALAMGYVHAGAGVYRRREGGRYSILQIDDVQTGLASAAAGERPADSRAECVAYLHGELGRLARVLTEPKRGSRTVQPARSAKLTCGRCGTQVSVFSDEVGETGSCPGCGAAVHVSLDVFAGM
jgi:general secretion pathway protein A